MAEIEPPQFTIAASDRYPGAAFQVIYADGISSIAPPERSEVGVVKMYLFRVDPDVRATQLPQFTVSVQVAMPVVGFVSAALFMEAQLRQMVSKGIVSKETVDQTRAIMDKHFGLAPS